MLRSLPDREDGSGGSPLPPGAYDDRQELTFLSVFLCVCVVLCCAVFRIEKMGAEAFLSADVTNYCFFDSGFIGEAQSGAVKSDLYAGKNNGSFQ